MICRWCKSENVNRLIFENKWNCMYCNRSNEVEVQAPSVTINWDEDEKDDEQLKWS
jgi:hypothetical protein